MVFAQWFIRLVLQSSLVRSLLFTRTHTHTHLAASFCTLVEMGTLPFPSLWTAAFRTRGKPLPPAQPGCLSSQPRLLPLPGAEGRCPRTWPQRRACSGWTQLPGEWGAAGRTPLSPLNPSAPGRGRGLGASDPGARRPPPFRGTQDHPASMKGQECRSSERLSQEGTVQHGQRNSRITEKRDVWFVLTTQTDALRHVCIYRIHMLSWEIRGQQHKTRIHDANAKKTYMATRLCICTCSCEGACFWSIDRVTRFACHFLHFFFALQKSVYISSTHSQTGPPDLQPLMKTCTSSKLYQVLKDKGYFILASTSSSKHICFTFSKNNSYKLHAPLPIAHQVALKNPTCPRACWFGVCFVLFFSFFVWACFCWVFLFWKGK